MKRLVFIFFLSTLALAQVKTGGGTFPNERYTVVDGDQYGKSGEVDPGSNKIKVLEYELEILKELFKKVDQFKQKVSSCAKENNLESILDKEATLNEVTKSLVIYEALKLLSDSDKIKNVKSCDCKNEKLIKCFKESQQYKDIEVFLTIHQNSNHYIKMLEPTNTLPSDDAIQIKNYFVKDGENEK